MYFIIFCLHARDNDRRRSSSLSLHFPPERHTKFLLQHCARACTRTSCDNTASSLYAFSAYCARFVNILFTELLFCVVVLVHDVETKSIHGHVFLGALFSRERLSRSLFRRFSQSALLKCVRRFRLVVVVVVVKTSSSFSSSSSSPILTEEKSLRSFSPLSRSLLA